MTTNEQIIIDGVEVSGCEFLFPHNKYNGCRCMNDPIEDVSNVSSMTCEGNQNCYYKQLKRKEELLRQAGNHIKDLDLMVHSGEERENELEQQLQRKAQECKQKDKTIAGLVGCVSLWEEFSDEESRLAKSSSIADLVVLLREARSSLENKTAECEGYFKQRNNILEECVRYQEEIGKLQKSQFCVAYEKDCHKVCKQQNCAIKNSYRYKQALDEIEEIANEPCIADTQEDCKSCDGNCEHKDILGIIRKAKGADNHG